MRPETTPTLWTIGHSTRPLAEFISLLHRFEIGTLVDVRRVPQSRRYPHFSREALARSLDAMSIAYHHLEGLGGMREPDGSDTNAGWRNPAFRGYADHMQTAAFETEIGRLIVLARRGRTAVMCAEALPARCHRALLADALTVRQWVVQHIIAGGGPDEPHTERHVLTPGSRVEDWQVTYPGEQTGLRLTGEAG